MDEIARALNAAATRSLPWLAPYADAARRVAAGAAPLHQRLNAALSTQPPIRLGEHTLRFVPQSALPEGAAYETFIADTGSVPTRDNTHDLFNGLVWMVFPALKRCLNRLQSRQIAAAGVGRTRGAVRDALTLFDENAAIWPAPAVLADALRCRDWHALFVTYRSAWPQATPILFGHALLDKLMQPRKPITAHLWLLPPDAGADAEAWCARQLDAALLVARPWQPLPVLGVPGWWPANEAPDFYADASVFRRSRTTS